MNIEAITTALNERVHYLLKATDHSGTTLKVVHRKNTWTDKVVEAEQLLHKVYSTLDEVLENQCITFNSTLEKEGFVHYLEPIVNDIVIRNISD